MEIAALLQFALDSLEAKIHWQFFRSKTIRDNHEMPENRRR